MAPADPADKGARLKIAPRWNPKLNVNTVLRIAVGIAVVLAFFLHEAQIAESRFLKQLEFLAYDARLRLFMPKARDPRIVIVDIDEKSLNAEGRWPWSRDRVATMVRQLFDRYQASVVGFDVVFSEADNSSGLANLEALGRGELRDNPAFQTFLREARDTLDYDRTFAETIARYPVVLGYFLGSKRERAGVLPPPTFKAGSLGDPGWRFLGVEASGYSGNIEKLQKSAAAAGHLFPALDFDGITRRVPIFMKYEDGYYESLSLAMARAYLGNVPSTLQVDPPAVGDVANLSSVRLGDLSIPLDDAMCALVPYRASEGAFRSVSATDVIHGAIAPEELRGKIVIVGTSAQGLLDLRSTPVSEILPGVEVHANLVSGILDQSIMFQPAEMAAISIITVLLVGLPLAILLPRFSALVSTGIFVVAVVVLVGLNLVAWKTQHYVLSLASPILMVTLLYLVNMAWGFFMETRSRRLITGLFGTYVPKELVDQMARNPEEYSMRGESRDMTVLFSDVRNFTSISEGLTAEGLKDLMNAYLTDMTEVIQDQRGTIDKYIGDAIMAFWGAPVPDADHVRHGVEAAIAMQRRIRALDGAFAKRGWPVLRIGVGVNCGEMSVGDMGSKFRRAYTVMGDAVNIASRLESLTKEYGVGILVTEYVADAAPGFVYRGIDRVVVKGRTEGLEILEPLGRVGEVPPAEAEEAARFGKALELYRRQRWDEAEALLKSLSAAAPDTRLYKVYLERTAHFRSQHPEAAWNGTWVFTTK